MTSGNRSRRADRVRRRRRARAAVRDRRRVPRPRPADPPPLRGLRRASAASFPIRRSRGYAPDALPLPVATPRPVVAVGAAMKSTFCVARDDRAHLSAHLGDLDTEQAYTAFRADLDLYLGDARRRARGDRARPAPRLPVDALGAGTGRHELIAVQHHHAHAAACMAEHGLTGAGAGARVRRHRLRHRRHDLGRRAAALRPRDVRARRASAARAAARRRGRDPRAVACRRRLPGARRPAGAVRGLAARPPEPRGQRAAVVGHGPAVRRGGGAAGRAPPVTYEGQAAIELEQLAGARPAEPYACRAGDG